ncbi:syncytin-1-like [Fukomys damarensis]|uniref:syncytin-1-like n=1 Tax=Fukomys damarensis TaxID=885580 RepID=UPI0008FEE379|nr:syncytin-1-like [Fukomys damarensis]
MDPYQNRTCRNSHYVQDTNPTRPMTTRRPLPTSTMKFQLLLLMALIKSTHCGFGNPHHARQLLQGMQSQPCQCFGGTSKSFTIPPMGTYSSQDCGDKMAYLQYASGAKWKCIPKPKPLPKVNGKNPDCPCTTFKQSIHSSCYSSYQECSHEGKTYYTATLTRTRSAILGGDWSNNPQVLGHTNKLMTAGCDGTIGQPVCWSTIPSIHITDGGGPQDQAKQILTKNHINQIIESQFLSLTYHPFVKIHSTMEEKIDAATLDMLSLTHQLLNTTNPSLAQDCWLCLNQGSPVPLAAPLTNVSFSTSTTNCSATTPVLVSLSAFEPFLNSTPACIYSPALNDTYDIDVGFITFVNLTSCVNISDRPILCPQNSSIFVCGNSYAYSFLPQNWTGVCITAIILPDIDIISGDTPVPIPTFDYISGRHKRAVQLIPLLAGLGISAAISAGTAGLGISIHKYAKLSQQLIDDVQTLSETMQHLQDQIDSLAEVVLQNRRDLDLFTAEQGGICLALQEKCCFYANKSGIVRDKIETLQKDLEKHRRELYENPFWNGLNGFLPYLLPLLGTLLGLLLLLSLGPILFNRLVAFIKQQIDTMQAKPIQIHYHRLDLIDQGYLEENSSPSSS